MPNHILFKNKAIFYVIVLLLFISYFYFTLRAPIQPATPSFELSELQRKIIQISFLALTALTWFFGAKAIAYSLAYFQKAPKETLGGLLRYMGIGISFLLFGMIAVTLVGQLRTYFPFDAELRSVVTIINNYLYVFSSLIGFGFFYFAAKHRKGFGLYNYNIVVGLVLTLVISGLWIGLIFTNSNRQISEIPGLYPSFYISDLLIITTIVLPTVFSWFLGIMAAFNFSDFSIESQNLEKQRFFSKIIYGIWALIFGYLILFGILSAGAERLITVGLGGVLLVIYFFITAILFAYYLIAHYIKKIYFLEQLDAHELRQ